MDNAQNNRGTARMWRHDKLPGFDSQTKQPRLFAVYIRKSLPQARNYTRI